MSSSNHRVKDKNPIHHVGSRIAHKVFFIEDSEKSDFLKMARRVAEFSGISMLGWCVMSNHFHLLLHLPDEVPVGESETLRRYGALKGDRERARMEAELAAWRLSGDGERADRWLDGVRRRMYSISSFMKTLKQWFTEEYNRRHSHKGTLWESAYFDRVVGRKRGELAKCLAYIHLNPVRAASAASPSEYAWSSYAAFLRGDDMAARGMQFVYGDEPGRDELAAAHEKLMRSLLEKEEMLRAKEIAYKRKNGFATPGDPLTADAMVAQQELQFEELRRESEVLRIQRESAETVRSRYSVMEGEVLCVIKMHPDFNVGQLMDALSIPRSTIYRILKRLKADGRIESRDKGGFSPAHK